jgi:NADH-quinone oxidoreductase subunit A
MQIEVLPLLLFTLALIGLAVGLLLVANLINPARSGKVKRMPYESGMDPVHDTRRRFDVRYYLIAIAFLVFDVELLFLYPWAVVFAPPSAAEAAEQAPPAAVSSSVDGLSIAAAAPAATPVARPPYVFAGGMVFLGLLLLGFVYDWRKGIYQWR